MGNTNLYLLVTTAVFFWGANFPLAGFVLSDLPPLWAAALRFVLGAALVFAIAGARREKILAPLSRHFGTYLMLGVVGIVAFNIFFFYALRYTSANNAALIMGTNPLFTAVLAALILREQITLRHLIALPVALGGVAIVVTQGKLGSLAALNLSIGDALMLGADLFWALYNVLCRRHMPAGSALVNNGWIMTAGAAVLLAVALGSGAPLAPLGAKASAAMTVMTIGGTVLAYLFWNAGLARLGAARTALFINLVPVFAMLVGAVFGTSPTPAQLAGGLLVLGGVMIAMAPMRRTVPA